MADAQKNTARYEINIEEGTVRRIPKGEQNLLSLWRRMAPMERSSTLGMLDYLRSRKRKPKASEEQAQPTG